MDNRKKRWIWASITVIALVLLMLISSSSNITSGARNIAGTLISPLHTSVSLVYGKLNEATDFLFGSRELRQDHRELSIENKQLKEDLAISQEIISRAEFLENEYELIKNTDYDYQIAYISAENTNDVFGIYTINIGSNKGIEEGDIVVSAVKYTDQVYKEGLVGVVSHVGANWARVNSVLSDNNSISFINSRNLDGGVLNSNGQDGLRGYTFDSDSDTRKGDKLLTSGMGGTYPRDIYIGEVVSVDKSEEFQSQISVNTEVDFSELYRVMVIDKDDFVNE